ncbi:MAG: 30S ribosomal protein S17 [Candidatus Andersenbacteria bacterium]
MAKADTNRTSKKRLLEGVVVRRSGNKTINVQTATVMQHPIYRKSIKRTKRYLVHDPKEQAKEGDMVTIQESRPLSARKRWVLVAIKNDKAAKKSK